jgi:DNA repair exonuclease SbcCD ATPase subunit
MGKVAEPVRTGKVAFDVERFELSGGERFEVGGRWFGVRGRRFIRPSLTLIADGFETRLLADLAHKPWAAEDGELWEAAFPSTDGWADAQEAELNVGPGLTVGLAVPSGRWKQPPTGRKPQTRRSGAAEHPQPAARRPRERPDHERALAAARAEIVTLRERIDELTRQLQDARGGSTAEVERARSATAEADAAREQALAARDEALARAETVRHEREATRRERDAALSQRDDARRELEAARRECDTARRECDAAGRECDTAGREREAATTALERAVAERDDALAAHAETAADRDEFAGALERTVAERDADLAAHAETAADRDELAAAVERTQIEHEQRTTATGAAMVMRNAALDSPTRESRWLALAIAGICVLIVVLVAALLFGLR